jgi:hypothetical protein
MYEATAVILKVKGDGNVFGYIAGQKFRDTEDAQAGHRECEAACSRLPSRITAGKRSTERFAGWVAASQKGGVRELPTVHHPSPEVGHGVNQHVVVGDVIELLIRYTHLQSIDDGVNVLFNEAHVHSRTAFGAEFASDYTCSQVGVCSRHTSELKLKLLKRFE